MKRILVPAAFSLFLVACGSQESETPVSAQAPASASADTRSAPVPADPADLGIDILAERNIEIPFSHVVNYDIRDVSRNGTPRRRVLVEILDGDFEAAIEQFGESLVSRGYSPTDDERSEGTIQRTFVREGEPTYYLLMHVAGAGPELRHAEAVGSVHIMWNDR